PGPRHRRHRRGRAGGGGGGLPGHGRQGDRPHHALRRAHPPPPPARGRAGRVGAGRACLVTGDMGIANTTPSAALIASLTELPAASVTGRGTGIDDAWLTRQIALGAAAAARARYSHGEDPLAILAEVGGLEHAALAGFLVGA